MKINVPGQTAKECFEERTTATLLQQDKILTRLEQKLEAPVLNGGFEQLIKKVDKIEFVTDTLKTIQDQSSEKIDLIHVAIYDPETGLYHKVKSHSLWIDKIDRVTKWLVGIIVVTAFTGLGRLLYGFFSQHIRFL